MEIGILFKEKNHQVHGSYENMLGYVIHLFEIVSQLMIRNDFHGRALYIFYGLNPINRIAESFMIFF